MLQKKILPDTLTIAQLIIQFLVFYKTCGGITVFTTA